MTDLALPDPQSGAASQVPGLVLEIARVRKWLKDESDVSGAEELLRRLSAYERYVADKQARKTLAYQARQAFV
jgi:hypothetical protein